MNLFFTIYSPLADVSFNSADEYFNPAVINYTLADHQYTSADAHCIPAEPRYTSADACFILSDACCASADSYFMLTGACFASTGACFVLAGAYLIPAGAYFILAGVYYKLAGVHSVLTGRSFTFAGVSFLPTGQSFTSTGRSFTSTGQSFISAGQRFIKSGQSLIDYAVNVRIYLPKFTFDMFKNMKNLKILLLLFCLIFSGICSVIGQENVFGSSVKATSAKKSFPNILRPVGLLFKWILGKNIIVDKQQIPVSVKALSLNKNEIEYLTTDKTVSLSNPQTIEVISEIYNPKNVKIHYYYVVTVGKIVGSGTKVIWDLTGVKPGKYAITAAVDDGCGVCGFTQTKTVTVK